MGNLYRFQYIMKAQSSSMRTTMNALAHIRRSLPHIGVAVISIALLSIIAFAHIRDSSQSSQMANAFVNSLHGPGFTFVAVFVLALFRIYRRSTKNYLHAAVVSMTIGVLSEAVQIPGSRDASASDLILDAAGILAGLGAIAIFDRDLRSRLTDRFRLGLGIISMLALVVTFSRTAFFGYAAWSQDRAMPTLLAFENAWEGSIYRQPSLRSPKLLEAPAEWPQGSNHIALATEAGRAGIFIQVEPYSDWSDYSTLSFILASGEDTIQDVQISVRDVRQKGERRSNRYVERLRVDPKPRRYEIDLSVVQEVNNGRPFNIANIDSITLSTTEPGSGVSLYLDDFRLEP